MNHVDEPGRRALRMALTTSASAAVLLTIGATSALAQEQQAQTKTAGAPIEEVIVTGTRIRQPNLVSNAPINVVTSQEIKLEGVTRVEDLLNNQPQIFAAQASSVNNGSNGTATLDLRGLGAARTLVLIDGHRVPPGDTGSTAVDVNNIPAVLVDRIDVDTLGAAATYGADAVAGVVNFILKRNFEGIFIDSEYDFNQHTNRNKGFQSLIAARGFPAVPSDITTGAAYNEAVAIGVNSENGKGNVTLWANYRYNQGVLEGLYDHSDCNLTVNGTDARGNGNQFGCAGSSTTNPARFVIFGPNGRALPSYVPTNTTGGTRAYNATTDQFNFNPYNYFERPDQRYQFGGSAHYQVSKYADIYTDVLFSDDDSQSVVAPSGVFFGAPLFNINCGNPFFQQQAAVYSQACPAGSSPTTNVRSEIGRRAVEIVGRLADDRHTFYRIDTGVRGDLTSAWSYDIYGQYGTTIQQTSQNNYFSNTRIQNALQVTSVNGTPTCLSGGNCVPLNVFTTAPISQAALNYLTESSLSRGNVTEQIVDGQINGDLGKYGVKSPLAANGVKIVFGGEYRRETLGFLPDQTSLSGDLAGAGGAGVATTGAFDVKEGFFEVSAPIVSDKPFVKELTLDGQYRYSDYNVGFTTDTFNVQVGYAPVQDLKFRVNYAQAVRVPSITDFFTPQRLNLFGGNDPCAGPTPAASAANCAFAGVGPGQYGNIQQCIANQCNYLLGGNPGLQPEASVTKTFGVVLTPSFLPGRSGSPGPTTRTAAIS